METCKTLVEIVLNKTYNSPKDWSSLSSFIPCGKPAVGYDMRNRPACEEHSL